MSLLELGVPNEILERLSKENYKDKEAKVRQQFRLLLVNKQFYNYFNTGQVWTNLFALYYKPMIHIPVDYMKRFIRLKHWLKVQCRNMTRLKAKYKIDDKYFYRSGIKPQQVERMTKLLVDNKVPNEARVQFVNLLWDIDIKKKDLSKLIRTKKNFKLYKQSQK